MIANMIVDMIEVIIVDIIVGKVKLTILQRCLNVQLGLDLS